ncbi:uncharacterized protein HMPREF1120_06830 [Exophiala dermatitidis NIH/UT8656]|uniref:Uncharacterized protein n=1 Tax=Exophiala dermatitidis (strain ATCC 34100 / CBS 525.76 / NIH/UT8656) TaxID=858893 RepID=H6C2V4_EXODN|nr:uncharacterized protein HMPREF1120_06830 [Exophiala dermatitidis NIH/UT8656]EHY58828.1 hypothetical protein HMPREF1120_06830 [Exophiala dermatitidis NIH/UT8656]
MIDLVDVLSRVRIPYVVFATGYPSCPCCLSRVCRLEGNVSSLWRILTNAVRSTGKVSWTTPVDCEVFGGWTSSAPLNTFATLEKAVIRTGYHCGRASMDGDASWLYLIVCELAVDNVWK